MRNRTFPKEHKKKMNETIRDLKAELRQKDKEVRFLQNELENIMKPVRERKVKVEQLDHDSWKKDFIKRWKKDVLGEKV